MTTVFMTGFPGFLGSELLPRILTRAADSRGVCLVQRPFAPQARRRLEQIEAAHPQLQGRVSLVIGDITRENLALEGSHGLAEQVTEIFHLAAVYDLAVARDVAVRVNVTGTRHLLRFAERCRRLQRLHYVSTCYVSGRFPGTFSEEDLECGQTFNNFYEESKYLAELEVQAGMRGGLATTIYRPAIVVGDSRTGATQKYDGPYFIIRWLLRQPTVALLPIVGKPAMTQVNLVPSDFVVDAMAHLSAIDRSKDRVYQLADPDPLTVRELLRVISRATGRKILPIPLPHRAARFAIDHVPGVYRWMKIPAPAIDYFVHPTKYSCTNTGEDLRASGIHVPAFPTYVDRLVRYVRDHPDIDSRPMA